MSVCKIRPFNVLYSPRPRPLTFRAIRRIQLAQRLPLAAPFPTVTMATYKVPKVENENNVRAKYGLLLQKDTQ